MIPFPLPQGPEHLDQEDHEDQPPETAKIVNVSFEVLDHIEIYFCAAVKLKHGDSIALVQGE